MLSPESTVRIVPILSLSAVGLCIVSVLFGLFGNLTVFRIGALAAFAISVLCLILLLSARKHLMERLDDDDDEPYAHDERDDSTQGNRQRPAVNDIVYDVRNRKKK